MIFHQSAALPTNSSTDLYCDIEGPTAMEICPPCRILVVDDDKLVRTWLSRLLSTFEYEVQAAATGIEALRVLEDSPCDIVITDWFMPDMDGPELCRQLRREKADADIYVLMLTVRHTELDMTAALAAGADDYVVKGAPFDEILTRLEIGRRISRQEHWRKNNERITRERPTQN